MIPPKIEKAIIKFISKSATVSELETLENWIVKAEHLEEFEEYVQLHYAINYSVSDIDTIEVVQIVLKKIRKDKAASYQFKLRKTYKYAAIFIVFLGIGYLYQQGYFVNKPTFIIPENSITLQLENGNIQIIAEDGTSKVIDSKGSVIGSQNGNQLVYDNEIEKEELEYNTLTVPYGKRFKIQLSDGTHVNLNAGTSLKYPVKFIEGENRQVYLLEGEAYFDVTKDTKHPFIVNSDKLDIKVLGTKFNVSAYPENREINTVLIEGSVSLFSNNSVNENGSILEPGFKGAINKDSGIISFEKVDTSIYTGWIDGRLIFKNIQFSEIIKKLERHYDITIVNFNNKISEEYFDATFDIETIEQVLNSFNKSYKFEYTIEEERIIIK